MHLRPYSHKSWQIFAWMNFVPGLPVYMDPCKFCCRLQSLVFICLRANFKTSRFCFVVSIFAKQPGKNITRFQALTALSEEKVARLGCLHESVRNLNRAGQKVGLLFSGPKLAHLDIQKFIHFRQSRVTELGTMQVFVCAKSLSGPV